MSSQINLKGKNLIDYLEKDTVQTIIKAILPIGNQKIIWALLECSALFYNLIIMSEDKNEELRPTKMRGVAFPKAKYGVILAIILIALVNFILYKETIFSFFK